MAKLGKITRGLRRALTKQKAVQHLIHEGPEKLATAFAAMNMANRADRYRRRQWASFKVPKMRAVADTRYSFTPQFLSGAAIFARRAHELEGPVIGEVAQSEYMACVVGSVTQAAAALEAEISEVTMHGPGHHLGSNDIDATARAFLVPLADTIDGEAPLHRYDLVLHLLGKPALDQGTQPYQNADMLVGLRNELIHYESKWGDQMNRKKLFKGLQQLRFEYPKFLPSGMTNFFPHRCLSSSLASWSVATATSFINAFYVRLGISSPLEAYPMITVLPPVSFLR
ncbi:hypothetical protein JQ615_26540 [Bradyrhizobium jicamae]|uniref:Uncharacterized protein n=1 Tax=Bradyrhizobium jicamae TaxID=280332 RepID=A0ABS5FQ74_9BRAD|nr:hypothetical protein [Bradyrhizobium jicamae]MBR0798952.1 hypothetical protein [Bradyrhizobium jicamae]